MFKPPPGEVRPVPPHAIHATGVGPYMLGTALKNVLGILPHGPRVVLLQIDGVLDYSVVRAEGDALVIGVEQPTGVTFLTVLDDHIARTAAGVGVGTTVGELRKAMGEELGASGPAMDPRMLGFQRLANARFVLDEEQKAVIAVVLRRDSGRKPAGTSAPGAPSAPATEAYQVSPCTNQLLEHKDELLEIARLGPDIEPRGLVPGCFSGNPEVAVVAADRLVVIGGEPGKLRRVASQLLPGIVYATAMDTDADGRHEIALVTETVAEDEQIVRLELVRIEAGKLARVALQDVYRITAAGAGWVGAKLEQIDLLIELRAGQESIRIGGLYVQRDGDQTSMVAPLLPTTMTVRRKRGATLPAVPGSDASIEEQSDGGSSDPEIPPVPAPTPR